jgi:hypothetical protein
MKYYFLFLISVVLLYAGCAVRQEPQQAAAPPKIYPEEQNFLETMGIGDTVFFFVKESGYSSEPSNPYSISYYTFYAKQEVIRTDSFEYRIHRYWALPEGHKSLYFELDTLKYKLKKAQKLFSVLESSCEISKEHRYDENNKCYETESNSDNYMNWKGYCVSGMCDPKYHEWRINPPSHKELKVWRESMGPNDRIWRYEILSFLGDTCKMSYSDMKTISFMRDFP